MNTPTPLRLLTLAGALVLALPLTLSAQREYGFDNTKPSGQPYLTPEESLARMKVADGWEVKLFAAEPDVINPIAFTIDEKGRVWVVECFEYPSRTPPGKMPRDRIICLEDTDGDGKADKRTVFAEGKDFPKRFDLASGIEVGHGGVFLGAPPYLWFLQDTKGTGKADKFDVLLSGFGSQDTHETLNTFQWGPDGRLYGLHGVFTQSEIVAGDAKPQGAGALKMNAAVWRYDVRAKQFETFAEGTSNPWGMDFDSQGNCFLCCCVIPHLFHVVPGGIYKRQAGASYNPYAYSYLNEICDHTFHKESGWAHAGLLCLDNPNVPEEYRNSVIFGSIHGCSIKRNVLEKRGSTFVAHKAPDFLVSGDKNFRPINLRWAPDGSIYVIDWHDQNPCHQAKPESWDYTHGRIYKIQRKGAQPKKAEDFSKKTDGELLAVLKDPNPYAYRTALRLLAEHSEAKGPPVAALLQAGNGNDSLEALRALWLIGNAPDTMSMIGGTLGTGVSHAAEAFRVWSVRTLAQRDDQPPLLAERLTRAAARDPSPAVRRELASAALRLAGKLDTAPILRALMQHKEDAADPVIPQLVWLGVEKTLAQGGAKPQAAENLKWLAENAPDNPLITDTIVPRTMRRLVATGKPDDLAACLAFAADLKDAGVKRQALAGLVEGLKGRQPATPENWETVYAALQKDTNGDVQRLTQQLAVAFRDAGAARRAVAAIRDAGKPADERAEAVRSLAQLDHPEKLAIFLNLLRDERDQGVRVEAARGIASFNEPRLAKDVIARWKDYPPPVRAELVNALKGRKEWARDLLDAVGQGQVARTDLTDNTILAIRNFKDARLNEQIEKVWGKFRESPAELDALIAKMRGFMYEGHGDPERGRKVFEKNCLQCHKFEGKGHDVGPNLDGAERSLEYLLANVLDPNRVVGQPYYMRTVLLKNGKLLTGLAAGEDDQTLSLKRENAVIEVIRKADIEEQKTEAKSLMPEGLDKNITPPEFRDLVRYLMANPFVTRVQVSPVLEQDLVPEKADHGLPTGIAWKPLEVGPAGRIVLGEGAKGFQYVVAEVTAPSPVRTRLQLGSNAPVQAWVNGKPVLTVANPAKEANPDQHGAEVTLQPGVNRVLFKVVRGGGNPVLYARFLDPDRKLTYPQ